MTTKNEELLHAWAALFEAHALAIGRVASSLEAGAAPLSLDEYDVLLVTSRQPEARIRLSELAEATVFTRSGISRVLRRLEGRKLLRRETCPQDRRGAYAVLTEEGKRALRDTWKLYSKAIIELLEPIYTQNEARDFAARSEQLIEAIRGASLVQIRRKLDA